MRDFSGIAEPETFTLHDLLFRLNMRSGGKPTPQSKMLMKRAIQDAIRGLPSKHEWQYYRRQTRFKTSPQQSMTVTYDASGGAEERLLTITSGDTWPEDATYGEILLGDRHYRIEKRISAIQATLESDFTPIGDFTADVLWQRRAYRFTRELAKVHWVQNITIDRPLTYMPSVDFQALSYDSWGRGYTEWFTWQNHGNRFGSSEFILIPSPINGEEFEVSATVMPHQPKIDAIGGPDLNGSQGTTQITSATSTFDASMIGAILRISRDGTPPTEFNYENWEFQAFITGVTDANTLILSEPLASNYSDRGFVISSPIDVDSAVMLEALEDHAYFQYTKNHDHESLGMAKTAARESLLDGIRRDNKVSLNSRIWNVGRWSFGLFGLGGIVEVDCDAETDGVIEQTLYLDELPANAVGNDGDQVYVTGGDLKGGIYERESGVWTYRGIYQLAMRDADPDTSVLPSGFQWRLVNQGDPTLNGIWEWDGTNAFQRVQDNV